MIWISNQETSGPSVYPSLRLSIVQTGSTLSGTVRDERYGVEVRVASGSIDPSGIVNMTVVLSDAGSLKQILIFAGQVCDSTHPQTISGTYTSLNPYETGRFVMSHE